MSLEIVCMVVFIEIFIITKKRQVQKLQRTVNNTPKKFTRDCISYYYYIIITLIMHMENAVHN